MAQRHVQQSNSDAGSRRSLGSTAGYRLVQGPANADSKSATKANSSTAIGHFSHSLATGACRN